MKNNFKSGLNSKLLQDANDDDEEYSFVVKYSIMYGKTNQFKPW